MGKVKELMEAQLNESGDIKTAAPIFGKRFVNEVMADPNFKPSQVSIRELFDETALRENPETDVNNPREVAEAIGHSIFPYVTKELIARELLPAYEYAMNGIENLVTEMETSRPDYEYIAGVRAISKMPRVRPGQNYPVSDIGEKSVRIEVAKFGEILEIERELVLSDQTGQILNRARMAGEMMGEHRHQYIVETIQDSARTALEEATSTALVYNGSAVTVYSNDHAAIDGVTNDNLAASSAISTASMDTVYGLFGVMTDEKSRYITVIPKAILVHPLKFRTAWSMCTDLSLESTSSANRGANFYAQKLGLVPYQSPYISTTTDWYVGDFAKQTVWMWYWKPAVDRQGVDSDAAFERDVVARFKYYYSAGCGLRDYRWVVKATA